MNLSIPLRSGSIAPKYFAVVQVLFASLLLALFAQIKIPLFFTPVPLTGQTFGVMLISVLLGFRKGSMAVLLYLIWGSLGLPVFAGGAAGIARFFGATGGYLYGFFVQSILIGAFLRNRPRSVKNLLSILSLSSLVQMGLGVAWLGQLIGYDQALMLGFYPFISGEILKILAVTAYCREKS